MTDPVVYTTHDPLEPPPEASTNQLLEWRTHRIRKLRNKIDATTADRDAMIGRYQEWHDAIIEPLLARLADETAAVRHILNTVLDADPKAPREYKLVSGVVRAREGVPTVEVDDGEAFAAWCHTNGLAGLLHEPKQEWRADKNAIKRAVGCGLSRQATLDGVEVLVTADGERLPGVRWVEKERSVTVDVAS